MARVKINHKAFGKATIASPEVRALVAGMAERKAAAAEALCSDRVDTYDGGLKRARSYVRRLGSGAAGEAKDGALSKVLGER